ncbi:MAG: hypothetical protein M3256_06345 [Actinomycetota bacterium]|nr:hypothetical protein [Actinomycetota bacterium]
MVQTGKMERARLVEDKGEDVGSKISSDVFSTDADTLFPLQAALGYDIAQSLFMGPDNLLVEGTSDFTYLTVLSDFLKAQGRNHLNDRWRLLPAGGSTNIPTFVALLGQHLEITVLMDAGGPTQKVFDLAKQGYLASKRLITVAEVSGKKESDIEDLFEVDEYLQLYNAAFGRKFAQGDLTGSDRILSRIARKQGTFDHGLPADYLLRNRDKILPTLSAKTLDRFEKLFETVNRTLT